MTAPEPAALDDLLDRWRVTTTAASWIERAWGILVSAGIAPKTLDSMQQNYSDHLVTAAALVYLADLFDDDGEDHSAWPPEIVGDDPLISEIELGRHAERVRVFALEYPETASELEADVVRHRMPAVARALAAEVGSSVLFAELWAMRQQVDVRYPLSDAALDEILNGPLTADKGKTFEWLIGLAGDS